MGKQGLDVQVHGTRLKATIRYTIDIEKGKVQTSRAASRADTAWSQTPLVPQLGTAIFRIVLWTL